MTTKRPHSHVTPYGHFTYHSSSLHEFLWGIRLQALDEQRQARVASPLKALFDLIRFNLPDYGQTSDAALFEYVELENGDAR